MRQTGWWYRKRPTGHSPADYVRSYHERIHDAAERLSRVALESRDALDLIRDYGDEPGVCLYVDPPYLGGTRATNYRVEMTTDDAHAALAEALDGCRASVVLSGYDSPLYAELFSDWHRTDLPGATALSGDTGRVEVLWSNVPLGETLPFDFEASA